MSLFIKTKAQTGRKSAGAGCGMEGRKRRNYHKASEIPTISGLTFKESD